MNPGVNIEPCTADDVLKFWFEDIEHSCWFKKDPEFDRHLEDRFGDVVKDATAGAKLPGGDFYQAALLNFRMIASAVLTTDEAVAAIGADVTSDEAARSVGA